MAEQGTAAYDGIDDLPPLVRAAVDVAHAAGFRYSCLPEQGALLRLLAAGVGKSSMPGNGFAVGTDDVDLSAPGTSATLRWRALSGDRMTSLHLYLCPELIEQTSRDLGGPNRLPDTLLFDDPLIAAMGGAINQALRRRAPALYADSVAQALAGHLLHTNQVGRISEESALGRSTLGRVIGYMREHLAEDVTLDDLAAQVNLSKFHLLRMFKKSTGSTPHAYLVRLRLGRAANLLQHSQLPVLQIAVECGYLSPGQFSATFRRAYGVSPRDYRTMVG